MGCDYYGIKEGKMEVEFRVYKKDDQVGKVYKLEFPVTEDCKIYQEISGDIRER